MNKVKLWGQLKHLGGTEYVDVADAATVDELVIKIAEQKEELAHMLVSEGQPNHSILVFINDQQHLWGSDGQIKESDSLTLMSPIAGG